MTKTLYDVFTEHTEMPRPGVRRFPASGNEYAMGAIPGTSDLVMVPIIDNIERADRRMAGKAYDVYAMVLKREGVIS